MADMGKKQQGLTLIELMVTLAMAIILVAVGMPLFSGIVANNRATTQANAVLSAMKLARSEAVKRATDVFVCAAEVDLPVVSPATPACDTSTPTPVSRKGWIIHSDVNDSGAFDAGDILRTWDALSDSATVAAAGPSQVRFGSTGEANGTFTFQLDDSQASGTSTRCITVTLAGQARSKRGTCP
jgi:type IV fimbrial biogenesis protein FimT